MTHSKKPSRRRFLRQAAALMAVPAAAAVPGLRSRLIRTTEAQPPGRPLRFLVLYNSLGIPHVARPDYFVDPSEGRLGELKPILNPLAAFRDHLVVVSGCDLATAFEQDVGGHHAGTSQGLTGTMMVDSFSRSAIRSYGPSIDVAVGDAIGAGTPYPSLQLNAGGTAGNGRMGASFGNDGRQLPRLQGARNIYRALFGQLASNGPRLDPTLDALTYAVDRANRLRTDVAGESREQVFEAYRSSVSEVAHQIEAKTSVVCEVDDVPDGLNARDDIAQTLRLVRNVFACDMSRSVFLDIGGSSSRIKHTWMPDVSAAGAALEHHTLSHETSDSAFRDMCMIRAGFADLYAEFLGQLASTPDGASGASLLDNTVILWATETASGAGHRLDDMPLVVIAGKNTGIKQGGHHIVAGGRPINDLHTGLLRAFGARNPTFGDPTFNSGPLDLLG